MNQKYKLNAHKKFKTYFPNFRNAKHKTKHKVNIRKENQIEKTYLIML